MVTRTQAAERLWVGGAREVVYDVIRMRMVAYGDSCWSASALSRPSMQVSQSDLSDLNALRGRRSRSQSPGARCEGLCVFRVRSKATLSANPHPEAQRMLCYTYKSRALKRGGNRLDKIAVGEVVERSRWI